MKQADSLPLKLQQKKVSKKIHSSRTTPLGIKITAAEAMVIPPDEVIEVPVDVIFPKEATCLFVERTEHRNHNQEAFFGAPSSLIQKDNPFLQIANFTDQPVTIKRGQLLGYGNDPTTYLDSISSKSDEELKKIYSNSAAIKTIVNDLLAKPNPAQSGQEEEELDGEVEGGPKNEIGRAHV